MNNRLIHFIAALCLFATAAFAETAADIRRRMAERLAHLGLGYLLEVQGLVRGVEPVDHRQE